MTPARRVKNALSDLMTQTEAARTLGTTPAYLSNILAGRERPSSEFALRICALVRLSETDAMELHLGRAIRRPKARAA